jgi:galactitol-specific phosphotransferase system IIC component
MTPLLQALAPAKGMQRVLLAALMLIPLLLVAASLLPSLTVLPFLPGRTDHVRQMVASLVAWTLVILKHISE